eukprot:TRINITY_DN13795_c0_g1_i1.p1 TRINITY_DN13795_c0_g1~~TRINITY_DN13795_c0_g1_i1.p1  ORF type:complete len:589 (+),score=117.85 TRINITY_DN13795_c0_g1_i1:34-1800(+)
MKAYIGSLNILLLAAAAAFVNCAVALRTTAFAQHGQDGAAAAGESLRDGSAGCVPCAVLRIGGNWAELADDCAANFVREAVASSLVSGGEKSAVCAAYYGHGARQGHFGQYEVLQGKAMSESWRKAAFDYAAPGKEGYNKAWKAPQPRTEEDMFLDPSDDWRMHRTNDAGGFSGMRLYRSANKFLWLKEITESEYKFWTSLQDDYEKHMVASINVVPRSFLVRVLGAYALFEQDSHEVQSLWLAMLDVAPPLAGSQLVAPPVSQLRCDIKPHQLSASPQSYSNMEACGALLHRDEKPAFEAMNNLVQLYAQRDLCWLHAHSVVDYSWMFARAPEGAMGSIDVKGQSWYVSILDILLEYGFGRQAENFWRKLRTGKELPKGQRGYANLLWADMGMYSSGKFSDYARKQFGVFRAIAGCVEDITKVALVCEAESDAIAPLAHQLSPLKVDRQLSQHAKVCKQTKVPFAASKEGLATKYASQRLHICKSLMNDVAKEGRKPAGSAWAHMAMEMSPEYYGSSSFEDSLEMEIAALKPSREFPEIECVWLGGVKCAMASPADWSAMGCLQLKERMLIRRSLSLNDLVTHDSRP